MEANYFIYKICTKLFLFLLIVNLIIKKDIGDWGLGIGDLGIGDWGLGPIPNPQSPFIINIKKA